MPDRTLAGGPPPVTADQCPPGTVWLWVIERASDATGKTIKANVYSTNMASYIAYGQIPGGPFITVLHPTDWEYPPSGGAPGLVLTAQDFVVAKAGFYTIEAQCADVRTHAKVQVGQINFPASKFPAYVDSQVEIRKEIAGQQAVTGRLG